MASNTVAPHQHVEHAHQVGIHKQAGYLLVEVALAVGVIALLIPLFFNAYSNHKQRAEAQEVGVYLAQYNSAIQSYLSDSENEALDKVDCTAGSRCELEGTNWLKDSTQCAVATKANVKKPYLACGFPNSIFGRVPTTYLFKKSVPDINGPRFFAVTNIGGFTDDNNPNQARIDLANRAASAANGQDSITGSVSVSGQSIKIPLSGTYFQFYTYMGGGWNYDEANEAEEPDEGDLIAEANTAPSLSIYLRTDGSNSMHGDLDMNGHDILNVSSITRGCPVGTDQNDDGKLDSALDVGGHTYPAGTVCSEIPIEIYDAYLESRNKMLSEGVYDVYRVRSGEMVPKPMCPDDEGQRIYAAISSLYKTDGDSKEILGRTVQAKSMGQKKWRVDVHISLPKENDHRIKKGEDLYYADVIVITKCSATES